MARGAEHRQGVPGRLLDRPADGAPAAMSGRCGTCSTRGSWTSSTPAWPGRTPTAATRPPAGWSASTRPPTWTWSSGGIRVDGSFVPGGRQRQPAGRSSPTTPSSTPCTASGRTTPACRCSRCGASCASTSTTRTCGEHRVELADADVAAGPLACSSDVDGYFRPILAGGARGHGDRRRPVRPRAPGGHGVHAAGQLRRRPGATPSAGSTARHRAHGDRRHGPRRQPGRPADRGRYASAPGAVP